MLLPFPTKGETGNDPSQLTAFHKTFNTSLVSWHLHCIWLLSSLQVYNIVSILYPRIQEEVIIRKNIARGPKGRGQYFSVLSLPLGFGGIIWTLSITLTIFRHAIKVNIALVPVWQDHVGRGVSILTMDMCPGQYGYGLPFRSQAEGNIALLT